MHHARDPLATFAATAWRVATSLPEYNSADVQMYPAIRAGKPRHDSTQQRRLPTRRRTGCGKSSEIVTWTVKRRRNERHAAA